MINKIYKLSAFVLIISFLSCKKDYLEYDYPIDGSLTEQEIFGTNEHARNFLNSTYGGLGKGNFRYTLNDELGLASASDEAVSALPSSRINILTNGTWGPLNLYDANYTEQYQNLRAVNIFLKNAPTSALIDDATLTKENLIGEAYFLRAMFHFELMKRYGSVVLATRPLEIDENLNLPKNTFEEVVAQIVSDCDFAASKIGFVAYLDQPNALKGRATKAAALALKARTLLYAASPLHNPNNDLTKWQLAADAAKAVIDVSGTKHGLLTLAQLPNLWNYQAQAYNKEVIFSAQTESSATLDNLNVPLSYSNSAQGRTNPTQELVDAFEMKSNGKNINENGSGYVANNPYNNRDSRLALFVNYNGLSFRNVLIDSRVGAKDRDITDRENRTTVTGYYLRKFLNTASSGAQRRAYVYFRYAEVLLNYAEALNEAQGPVAAVYTNINLVRVRAGQPALQSTNPLGNGYVASNDKDAMRLKIQNERRVELCFEEHRFFDVRRWKKGEEFFNKPVTGVQITGSVAPFTYTYITVQNRVFTDKMYLFPFPQAEINKQPALVQNPLWQ